MEARSRETAVCLSDGTTMERWLVPGETWSAYSLCFASPRGAGWGSDGGESMRDLTRCGEGLAGCGLWGYTVSPRDPGADGYIKA